MKKNKDKTIEEYIVIAKYDIIVWFTISIILSITIIMLYHKKDIYFYIFLIAALFILSYGKILAYKNIKKIKNYLIKSNLIDKIGKIYFWNDEYYMLTENFMIIVESGIVEHFKYEEIKEIFVEKKIKLGRSSNIEKYLNIVLKDERRYIILIYTTMMVNEEYKDISDFLLEKNNNINYIKDKSK